MVDAVATWDAGRLTERQRSLVLAWIGEPTLVADLSWNHTGTTVLRLRCDAGEFIVKAAGTASYHMGREIEAHQSLTWPLVDSGRGAHLVAADHDANVLVLEYLEGELVEGTLAEWDGDVYRQAGVALRDLHAQWARQDDEFDEGATQHAFAWLDKEHRIDPAAEAKARAVLAAYQPRPVTVVPTHGDWQPRNWLIGDGIVKVIDYGRFDYRPPATDLCRLAVQQWRDNPQLEKAFLDGYGGDPRDETWPMLLLREAVGTVVWAYRVGDAPFEAQGHRMLADALARFEKS